MDYLRPDQGPAGEDFDFDDDQQMHHRPPRLAAACLPDSTG